MVLILVPVSSVEFLLGKVLLICDRDLDQHRNVEFVNIQWLLLYFSILFKAVTLLEKDPPKMEVSGFLI